MRCIYIWTDRFHGYIQKNAPPEAALSAWRLGSAVSEASTTCCLYIHVGIRRVNWPAALLIDRPARLVTYLKQREDGRCLVGALQQADLGALPERTRIFIIYVCMYMGSIDRELRVRTPSSRADLIPWLEHKPSAPLTDQPSLSVSQHLQSNLLHNILYMEKRTHQEALAIP
jgi:hypothetical protein